MRTSRTKKTTVNNVPEVELLCLLQPRESGVGSAGRELPALRGYGRYGNGERRVSKCLTCEGPILPNTARKDDMFIAPTP
jgi:hypothetical protein